MDYREYIGMMFKNELKLYINQDLENKLRDEIKAVSGPIIVEQLKKGKINRRTFRFANEVYSYLSGQLFSEKMLGLSLMLMWREDTKTVLGKKVSIPRKFQGEIARRLNEKYSEEVIYAMKREEVIDKIRKITKMCGYISLSNIVKETIGSVFGDRESFVSSYKAHFGLIIESSTPGLCEKLGSEIVFPIQDAYIERFSSLANQPGLVQNQADLVFENYLN